MSRFRKPWAAGCVALVGALLTLGPPAFAQGEKTVRAVMHAEVKWVDPHWTTANITQQHAYMIYETLFALDAKGNPRPQMVDTFRMSPDKLTYTFVLRNGLKWHDGQPVRAIDAVASLKRWAVKDAAGQKLMAKTASLEATDDKTLVLKLKEPYGLVLRALAKEYSYVPFIIPERQAVQPADKAFEGDKIGSGPYVSPRRSGCPAPRRSTSGTRTTCRGRTRPTTTRAPAAPPSTAWSGWSSPTRPRRWPPSKRARWTSSSSRTSTSGRSSARTRTSP